MLLLFLGNYSKIIEAHTVCKRSLYNVLNKRLVYCRGYISNEYELNKNLGGIKNV